MAHTYHKYPREGEHRDRDRDRRKQVEGRRQGSPSLRKKQVILKTEGKLHQSRGSLKRTGLPPPSYPSAVSPEPTSVSPNKSR